MSCSKWAYDPKKCEGDYCCGDCDLCNKADNNEETTIEEIVKSMRWKNESKTI